MTNPLSNYTQARSINLLEWCEEQNRKPLTARMGRWYYVTDADGVTRCNCLDGEDGFAVHNRMNGKEIAYAGWPAARMKGYLAWIDKVIRSGMAA